MASRNSYVVKLKPDKAGLWANKRPKLANISIELTERCNNNCIHCYINLSADDNTAKQRELSTFEIKGILKEAASLGCLVVKFTGGEPLLRDDFEDLYLFARRLGLKVQLLTNATLITPQLSELFAQIPPKKTIEVSIYGMKKKTYEAVSRVSGSFEASMCGINLLIENKVPFIVKGGLLLSNKHEIEDFESWAATIPWMCGPTSYLMFLDLRGRRDSAKKNHNIKKLRVPPAEALKILYRNREYIKEMKEFSSKFMAPQGDKLFSCGAGKGGCVDAYGVLQPCLLLRHPKTCYDLKKGSLEDGITRFFPEVRKLTAVDPAYLERCANCFLKGLCEQCPAKSWMEHGTLDTPVEYSCQIAHAQAKNLGLLEDGENAWEISNWKERIKKFSGKSPSHP